MSKRLALLSAGTEDNLAEIRNLLEVRNVIPNKKDKNGDVPIVRSVRVGFTACKTIRALKTWHQKGEDGQEDAYIEMITHEPFLNTSIIDLHLGLISGEYIIQENEPLTLANMMGELMGHRIDGVMRYSICKAPINYTS